MNLIEELRSRPFHTAEVNIPLYVPRTISERVFRAVSAQCDRIGVEHRIKTRKMSDGRVEMTITVKGLGKQITMLYDDLDAFVEANSVLR